VVPAGRTAPPSADSLRADLAAQLPPVLVPAAFVLVPSLPLTRGGQVDRQALLALAPDRPAIRAKIAPRHPLEEVIAGFWAEVLRSDPEEIGVEDNFFQLGGHSLMATQVVSRVTATFQVELPLRRLFESPTVAGLATAVLAAEKKPGQSEKIARIVLKIKKKSPAADDPSSSGGTQPVGV
jgi:acyl carrier protein